MIRALSILILFACLRAGAASWYVDSAAAAYSANTGTNWLNAWTNDASINWTGSGIMPGDTLFISGGSGTKVYSETITAGKDGTLTALTGTVSASSNGWVVTGSGTSFTTELSVGQTVVIGREARRVLAINSNTSMNMDYWYRASYSGVGALRLNAITIRIGQDENHNGVADFGTNDISRGTASRFGLIVDGHRGLNYANPTNWYQVDQMEWTNNIGFLFRDKVGTTTTLTDPVFATFNEGSDHNVFRYIKFSGYTNTASGFGFGLDERGVIFSGVPENIAVTNLIFENLYLYGNSGSSWRFSDATNDFYGGIVIQRSRIEATGEDIFFCHPGLTVRDCSTGPYVSDDVHMDLFQIMEGWFEFYNNRVRESGHSYGRMQMRGSKDPAAPKHNGHVRIFNNVFDEKLGRGWQGGCWNEGMVFVNHGSEVADGGYGIWTNILIANNTFYNSVLSSNNLVEHPNGKMIGSPAIDWPKGGYVTNCYLKDIWVFNNLFVSRNHGVGFPSTTNTGGMNEFGIWNNYEPFTTNDFQVNYNVMAGYATALIEDPRSMGYLDVSGDLETHAFKFLNTTNHPQFVDLANANFELDATDTAALNTGTNLSVWFTFDSLNRPRGALWSRGAMESDAGLVLFYSFDNDAAGGDATDDTGNGYTGRRFTLSEYSYPSNRLASDVAGSVFRPGVSGRAAEFLWHTNNGVYNPTYLDDGAFFGVTNAHNTITNLGELTVLFWGRHNRSTRTDKIGADSSTDGNASFISFGGTAHGTVGSFDIGRLNQLVNGHETRLMIRTNGSFTGSWGSYGDPVFGYSGLVVFNYLDAWGFANNGDTTNWVHYGMTWSNGIAKTYFNAVCLATNDMSGVVTKLRLGDSDRRNDDWIGLGVNTHKGTPEFDDEGGAPRFPNFGWLNGALDQVRIYTRVLSWQEIVDIANSEGGDFDDAPAGGGGSPSPAVGRTGKIRGIRLR